MDLTGYLLGNRYEILEKIGDGGMATVYKAKCRVLNRMVAVKILKEEYINDVEFSKKFATEAQAAASLSHPNIVSVYDVGREGNINYIVMELIDGITLKQYIKENGKLHWREACKIAYQIAQGIENAHKNHIIHRDIKPHNIIISKDGQVKVTDFGIAKAVTSSTITMNRDAVGSVHYFSPEQAKGGLTTEKSDIYSLGVTMYEMLTGILPFEGESPVAVALKHVQEKPKPPCDVEITVPYSVSNIVMKAMQKDINLRYNNISDMALDISLALNDPNTNNVNIESYIDSPTQRIKPIKEEILDEKNDIKINPIDTFFENSNEIKNNDSNKRRIENNNKKKMGKRKKKMLIYLIVGVSAIVLFTIAFIGGLYLTGAINRANDVEIPEIVNMTVEEATAKLTEIGLNLEIEQEINSQEVEIGLIISQTPNATMKTKKGNSIKVIVSKGPAEVEVPSVINKNSSDAKYEIERIGLIYQEQLENNMDIPKGTVIRQTPEPGNTVNAETTVLVYVSNGVGDGKVKMPKLTELTEKDARNVLIQNELRLKEPIVYKSESNKPDGVVLSQSIPEDSIINIDTQISIEVNKIKVEEEKPQTVTHNIYLKDGVLNIDLTKYNEEKINVKIIDDNSKTLYDKNHNKSEEIAKINIDNNNIVYIQVYINNIFAKKVEI